MHDVAGETPKTQREFCAEPQNGTDEDEDSTEKKKSAAEFAQRLHQERL